MLKRINNMKVNYLYNNFNKEIYYMKVMLSNFKETKNKQTYGISK